MIYSFKACLLFHDVDQVFWYRSILKYVNNAHRLGYDLISLQFPILEHTEPNS